MIRFPDWRTRLQAYYAAAQSRSFAYGEWDCVLHAAEAVQVMTGVDLAEGMRGTYTTAEEAQAKLNELGFSNVIELVEKRLPVVKTPLEGDIVAIQFEEAVGLAVMARGFAQGCRPDKGLWPVYDEPLVAFRV